jgi:5-carboxymethyl-2-hydroxymuconate isomerase
VPHITLEYSANLDGRIAIGALCERVLEAALATGVFETGAVRVRAVRCEAYAIADRHPENAFVDGSLRMGRGRDAATRKEVGEAIFDAMAGFLEPQFAEDHFALSFEVREIDSDLSFKKNSMHRRFRG